MTLCEAVDFYDSGEESEVLECGRTTTVSIVGSGLGATSLAASAVKNVAYTIDSCSSEDHVRFLRTFGGEHEVPAVMTKRQQTTTLPQIRLPNANNFRQEYYILRPSHQTSCYLSSKIGFALRVLHKKTM